MIFDDRGGCCLYSKGKNFRANHNLILHRLLLVLAVAYIAKVRILEQITTCERVRFPRSCCCLYSKGKNFRANHNKIFKRLTKIIAVAYIAKVRILEQITTHPFIHLS